MMHAFVGGTCRSIWFGFRDRAATGVPAGNFAAPTRNQSCHCPFHHALY